MPRLEFEVTTPTPPEKIHAALIDFTDRRPELWPDLAPEFYEVYEVGEKTADVKEGSSMPGVKIWAREHYDWSVPGTVEWTVAESNFCVAGSGVKLTITPEGEGSKLHVAWERRGSNVKGHMIIGLLKLTNGAMIKSSVKKAVDRLGTLPDPA